MAKIPYVQSGTGSVTGYEDYPDWENWASEWPGTAATDPTRVPPPIEDYSFNFRPEEIDPALMPGGVDAYEGYSDWAQGAGVEPNPFGMFNDAQFIQAYGEYPQNQCGGLIPSNWLRPVIPLGSIRRIRPIAVGRWTITSLIQRVRILAMH